MASDAGATAPRASGECTHSTTGAIETDFERQPVGVAPTGDSLPDVATGGGGRSPALPMDDKGVAGLSRAIDSPELRRYLARLENLDEDIADLRALRASVVREFKGRGYDPRALAEIIRDRRADADKLADHRAVVDLYREHIGDGPLFEAVEAETAAAVYHDTRAREKAKAIGKATDRVARVIGDAMEAKQAREQRERSADEARVDVTTPKGRKASLKASDPIAYQTLSIEGHSAFCDCADCRELRRDTLATNSGANAAPANGKAGTDSARQPLARSGDGESPTAKKPASKAAPKRPASKGAAPKKPANKTANKTSA